MKESNSPFSSLSDKTPVKLPLALWLTTMAFACTAGGAWVSLKGEISTLKDNYAAEARERMQVDKEIKETVSAILKEVHAEQKTQRELLIRVDERLKKISP